MFTDDCAYGSDFECIAKQRCFSFKKEPIYVTASLLLFESLPSLFELFFFGFIYLFFSFLPVNIILVIKHFVIKLWRSVHR